MCGIGVVWGKAPDGKPKRAALHAMLAEIRHRGNSLFEIAEAPNGKCVLGANRLEIVDRDNGRQPKTNEDATIYAVFNGEIFNNAALRAELEAAGHVFASNCDTETLCHAYEEWRERMLDKIDSEMFAFAVYDAARDELFVARDAWGVKPLYWAEDEANGEANGTIYFASEIKQLVALKQVKRIKLFPSGHYCKNGEITKYAVKYAANNAVKTNLNEKEAALILRELVDEAVRKRVATDLPIGVFLSGGLDSTAILATARKHHGDVTAIIIGNDDSEDARVAKRYCKENGVKFVFRKPPTEEELFASIEETIYCVESFEPNLVRQSALSLVIAKTAKEAGLRIALCGEGADELFLGYPEFKALGKRRAQEVQNSFMKNLNRTQFQRVDRTAMRYTVEVRVPFFDEKIVEFANTLPVEMKLRKTDDDGDGEKIEKSVLREAMADRLPPEICWRKKAVLSEGAGYGGNGSGGLFEALATAKVSDEEFAALRAQNAEWNLRTKEEAFYFKIFKRYGYCKAEFNKKRVAANAANSLVQETPEAAVVRRLEKRAFTRFPAKKRSEMLALVKRSIQKKKPLEFFMLWGVWKKTRANGAEKEALEIISEMLAEVKRVHAPGGRVTIVLADSHAELNLMDKASIYAYDSYAGSFERFAQAKGFTTKRLSDVIAENYVAPRGIKAELERIQNSEYWPILVASASKYYEGENKTAGAKRYVEKRLAEKPTLEKAFPNAIFLTYNGPRYDVLAPDVPTSYPVANRARTNEKPWFALEK